MIRFFTQHYFVSFAIKVDLLPSHIEDISHFSLSTSSPHKEQNNCFVYRFSFGFSSSSLSLFFPITTVEGKQSFHQMILTNTNHYFLITLFRVYHSKFL